jgi:RecG-like helicase
VADTLLPVPPSLSRSHLPNLEDTETVAQGLKESSNGKIKTGVYHADVGDEQKHSLHRRWREGKVNVVVATIAFGLGIDKGDGTSRKSVPVVVESSRSE